MTMKLERPSRYSARQAKCELVRLYLRVPRSVVAFLKEEGNGSVSRGATKLVDVIKRAKKARLDRDNDKEQKAILKQFNDMLDISK